MLDDIIEALMVRPAPRDPEAERAWQRAAESSSWSPSPGAGEPLPPPRDTGLLSPPWTPNPWRPVDETEGKLLTIVRLEIPEAGEYAVEHGSLPLGDPVNPLRLQPTEPSHEDIGDEWSAEACVYPHAPPHFAFPRAGQYELTAGCRPSRPQCSGEHEIDQASEAPLSARATGNENCDPY